MIMRKTAGAIKTSYRRIQVSVSEFAGGKRYAINVKIVFVL